MRALMVALMPVLVLLACRILCTLKCPVPTYQWHSKLVRDR